MAIYRVQGPDGAVHRFEGPDDATPEQITTAASQQFGGKPVQPREEGKPKRASALANAADTTYATVEGLGKGALNIGGFAGALGRMGGSALRGDIPSFWEIPSAYVKEAKAYDAARAARAARHPVASTAGYLGGAAVGGGVVTGTLGLAGRAAVPGAISTLPKAAGLVRKGANLIGIGAAAGGAQALVEGDDAATGAALGGAAGPVGAALGRAGAGMARYAAGKLSKEPSANAMRALGKQFKMTADEMDSALGAFQAKTGRPASLVDIADLESQGKLKTFARDNPTFGAELGRELERRTTVSSRADTLSRTQPLDVSTMTSVRKVRMDRALTAIGAQPVQFSLTELADLASDTVSGSLPKELRRKIIDAYQNGVSLTVRDVENIRYAFGKRQGPGEAHRFGDYKAAIEAIGTRASPRYGQALDDYRSTSKFIDAFEHGKAGRTLTGVMDENMKQALASPEGKRAYAIGTAERLAQESLENIAPASARPTQGMSESQLAHLAVALAQAGSSGWGWYHLARAIPGMRADEKTLKLAARYLTEPNRARQGLALLRKSGATNESLEKLLATTAGASAGGAQ